MIHLQKNRGCMIFVIERLHDFSKNKTNKKHNFSLIFFYRLRIHIFPTTDSNKPVPVSCSLSRSLFGNIEESQI